MNCHWTLTQEGYLASAAAAAPSAVSANEDSERPLLQFRKSLG